MKISFQMLILSVTFSKEAHTFSEARSEAGIEQK